MFQNFMRENKKVVLGLIHLLPLPGTVYYKEGDLEKSIEKAKFDAKALEAGGAHGCLIQTVDKVYPSGDDTDYVRATTLAVIANEVKKVVSNEFKVGVQIMWNCITPSLAVGKAVGADFTRCTALIGETESPFGKIVANPIKVMEYRNKIEANSIAMIAEVHGYHFKASYDKNVMLSQVAAAKTVGAEAVEVYDKDESINNSIVKDIKEAFPEIPVVLGGGTNIENVKSRLRFADAVLVGSCFENNEWGGNIDVEVVKKYMGKVNELEQELNEEERNKF